MRKLIILFTKVAPNCHGKRNNRGAKKKRLTAREMAGSDDQPLTPLLHFLIP